VHNIKIDFSEIGWIGMDRIDMVQEGSCEDSNESSVSIKFWDVLEWLRDLRLLKKGSAPWS
jgi:hypothetical protein